MCPPAKMQPSSNERRSAASLLICAVGICSSYLCYGILQEQLFANARVGASFVLLSQGLTNTLVALLWQSLDKIVEAKSQQPSKHRPLNHSLLLLTSFCYFVAMAASNESLHFVSYPTAVLAKSSKLIPTMILGALVERRSYTHKEWLAATCITGGVVLFNLSRINGNSSEQSSSLYGISLLVLSLVADGLLGACQGLLKSNNAPRFRTPTATETMLYVNLYAAFFLFPLSLVTGEWSQGLTLLIEDPSFLHDMLWLNAAAATGQIFIFLTVTWYSSLLCTTITTTRKFFTILLSVIHFGHVFSKLQWLSVVLVFCGLYMGIVSKARVEKPKKE